MNWIVSNKDLAEALSYWATAFGIVVAVAAGIWVLWKYIQDRRMQRWLEARALIADVINMSIQYPELNGKFWENVDQNDHAAIYRYEFYISKMLMAFEEIIYSYTFDDHWKEAIKLYIKDHINYFVSKNMEREMVGYNQELREIISETILEFRHTATVVKEECFGSNG